MTNPTDPTPANRTYTLTLTFAVMLFLGTLTMVLVLIIIGGARDDEREKEIQRTLTAAFSDLHTTKTALAHTPTSAPPVTLGEYAFALQADSPSYTAAPDCANQVITGSVLDRDGQPVDGFSVQVWSDYAPVQMAATGLVTGMPAGRWQIALPGMVHRRAWVQLAAGDRYVSAPVEIVFDQDACDRGQVEIVLAQVGPLE